MLLKISSPESLDAAIASIVREQIELTRLVVKKDAELAAVLKKHDAAIQSKTAEIAALEEIILHYCTAHRAELFPDKKSRETGLAVFGFELTPWRVETSSRKIKWKDVVERLQRLRWGQAYVRTPDPLTDKQALLADREKLDAEKQLAAGIRFEQDEQFYIRPKPESAAESVQDTGLQPRCV